MPSPSRTNTGKAQTPACPRTGSNKGVPGLQVQHQLKGTSGEERASPPTNAIHHKPTQSHGTGRAVAGLLKPEGLQGDRHGLLGVQGNSNQVSPPFLPTAANPTDTHNQKIYLKTNPGI